VELIDYVRSALQGTLKARNVHERALASNPGIRTGVETLQKICPSSDDSSQPIFLFSAGWRAGSTLMQRLIMSDTRILMWGEPYDECGVIQALAETTKAFREDWPPQDYYYHGVALDQLPSQWIANLFPSVQDLRLSYIAVFDAMFAKPAERAGAERWGIKEVRLDIEHAWFLRWLYPQAQFIFLYRNPLDAYQSYCRYGRDWYYTWPNKPVFTPTAFGNHWRKLVMGYLREAEKIGAMLVCYEDLVSGELELEKIEQFLGIQIDHRLLNNKVGSSDQGGEKAWVSRFEKWLLRRAVSPMARELNYEW